MNLRDEVMLMLDHRGAVLDTARLISRLMRENNINGAIVGGISVVLHGHLRTTKDVDVLVPEPLDQIRPILEAEGMQFDSTKKEFVHDAVPVHLVTHKMIGPVREFIQIDEITTLTLADLINAKLTSGLNNLARAQDIADVVGLVRHHKLDATFASRIQKPVRSEFRRIVKAVLP